MAEPRTSLLVLLIMWMAVGLACSPRTAPLEARAPVEPGPPSAIDVHVPAEPDGNLAPEELARLRTAALADGRVAGWLADKQKWGLLFAREWYGNVDDEVCPWNACALLHFYSWDDDTALAIHVDRVAPHRIERFVDLVSRKVPRGLELEGKRLALQWEPIREALGPDADRAVVAQSHCSHPIDNWPYLCALLGLAVPATSPSVRSVVVVVEVDLHQGRLVSAEVDGRPLWPANAQVPTHIEGEPVPDRDIARAMALGLASYKAQARFGEAARIASPVKVAAGLDCPAAWCFSFGVTDGRPWSADNHVMVTVDPRDFSLTVLP